MTMNPSIQRSTPQRVGFTNIVPSNDLPSNNELFRALEEQRELWKQGRRALVEIFLATTPALKNAEDTVQLILQEVKLRQEQGEYPCCEEYVERFPEYETAILCSPLGEQSTPEVDESSPTLARPDVHSPNLSPTNAWPSIRGYQILSELGHGGMGKVYRACQLGLKRLVAIKTILPEYVSSPEMLQRFQSEAEAIGKLRHPNIVEVFDVGMTKDDSCELSTPYIILEYLEGGDLFSKWEHSPQPEQEAAAMLIKLSLAMDAAHQKGIIHRDLKPANVLLTDNDEPRITDFGLVKTLHRFPDPNAPVAPTRQGLILGTPEYMSPEQAEGGRQLRPTSDIYSLGVMLYEALIGRCPFEGVNEIDTIDMVRQQEPISPKDLRPDISQDLNTICLKCLEKKSEDRYQTAKELAEDLQRFLDRRPVLARPVGRFEKFSRWCQRNPAISSLLFLLIVVLILGVSLVTWKWREAETRANSELRAKLEASQVSEDLFKANEQLKERSAEAFLRVGFDYQQRGYTFKGLDWLIQSLELFPPEKQSRLADVVRTNFQSWSQQLHPCRAVFTQPGWVWELAFSPDGTKIATAGSKGHVRIWDRKTGRIAAPTMEHAHPVWSLCFSADGKILITGSGARKRGGTIQFWEADTGKRIGIPLQQQKPVLKVVLSPDNQTLLSFHNRGRMLSNFDVGEVHFWRVDENHISESTLLQSDVTSMTFSKDGKSFFTGSVDGKLRVWSSETGKLLHNPVEVPHHALDPAVNLNSILFVEPTSNPDIVITGQAAISKTKKGSIIVADARKWNWKAQQNLGKKMSIPGIPKSFELSADEKRLTVGMVILTQQREVKPKGLVQIFDVEETRSLQEVPHPRPVWSARLSPDHQTLITGCEDQLLRFWDANTGTRIGESIRQFGPVRDLKLSPDGTQVATGGIATEGIGTLCDLPQRALLNKTRFPLSLEQLIAISDDGKKLALRIRTRKSNLIRIWQPEAPKQSIGILTRAEVKGITFSPKSQFVVIREAESRISVWDLRSKKPKPTLLKSDYGRIAFVRPLQEEGTFLLVQLKSPKVRISKWKMATGKVAKEGEIELSSRIMSTAISQNNQCLAMSTNRKQILIFDRSHKSWRTIEYPQQSRINSIILSNNGKYLLAGTRGGIARLWDTDTGNKLHEPFLVNDSITATKFNPSDSVIALGTEKGNVYLFDRETGFQLAPPFTHANAIQHMRFLEDGKQLMVGTQNHFVTTWKVPQPVQGTVQKLRRWLKKQENGRIPPQMEEL